MQRLTEQQIAVLTAAANSAEDWQNILVSENFDASKVRGCHFEGRVEIEGGVTLIGSTICNYHIGANSHIESVTRLECRTASSFGNGVAVAAVNENGGRTVIIHNELTAQTAYIVAMYRHRKDIIEASNDFARDYAQSVHKNIGTIGKKCKIVGAKFVREVNMEPHSTIEGASLVQNGTLHSGAYIGVDVKAVDFIAAQNSRIDLGAIVDHCFIGENSIVAKGYSAVNSLIFASAHLENGECCAIFAGPYVVSHHKSSLLIAGMFSFLNAGSGTNQSNHLFKGGAIHQSVHRRGCKFGSNGYVMNPAAEGEYTTILGRHTKHHDTSAFPFSYLIENQGVSLLMPGYALRSYGIVRDIEKWRARDHRTFRRDIISYNEYNPYITSKVLKATKLLESQIANAGDSMQWHYNNTTIKRGSAQRGLALYKSYLTAALGAMLSVGSTNQWALSSVTDKWVDLAGQYVSGDWLERVLDSCTSADYIGASLIEHHEQYDNFAYSWALSALSEQLGREANAEDIAAAIAAGKEAHEALRRTTEIDRLSDIGEPMSVGYGTDSDDEAVRWADFCAVHGLE